MNRHSEIVENIIKSTTPKEMTVVRTRMRNAIWLSDFISDHGISKDSFADLMNVDKSTIDYWLSGTYDFTEEELNEIKKRLK